MWSDAYDHPEGHDQDGWDDVAVDSAGDVIVVGTTQPVEDDASDIIVRKYHRCDEAGAQSQGVSALPETS